MGNVLATGAYGPAANPVNTRCHTLNGSTGDHVIRAIEGPAGLVVRDIGQVQLFAGKTQSIWSIKGERIDISTVYANHSEKINFFPRGITNFRILGKFFTKTLFDGQKVLAVNPGIDISKYSVTGPNGNVPLSTIFTPVVIFDKDPNEVLPAYAEIFSMVKTLLG